MKNYCVQSLVLGTLGSWDGGKLTSSAIAKSMLVREQPAEAHDRMMTDHFKPAVWNLEHAETVALAFSADGFAAEISETMLPLNPVQSIDCPCK